MKYYINRGPVILALFMGLITGITCYSIGLSNNKIYLRALIAIVIFYLTGLYIRKTLNILVDRKKEHNEDLNKDSNEENKGTSIDFVAEDTRMDEFEPMKVSKVIKKEMIEKDM